MPHRLQIGAAAAVFSVVLFGAFAPTHAVDAKPVVRHAVQPNPTPTHVDPDPAPTARERAAGALAVLGPKVGRTSRPDALGTALGAYYRFAEKRPGEIRKPLLYFVDYGLSNSTPRGWVIDMERLEVVEGPFTVAHGRGSSRGRNGVPTRFSNRPGSNASSLGVYVAEGTYGFHGRSGGRGYSSIGLRLRGVSGSFNDAALRRGVVAHGAPYVTARDAGRSEGCPAMSMDRARRLLPRLANGGVVILYSPRDREWLSGGPWVAGS